MFWGEKQNLGVGENNGKWLSIQANAPTNPDGKLDFNIRIKGHLGGSCRYENGKYYQNGNENDKGCTVSVFFPPLPYSLSLSFL